MNVATILTAGAKMRISTLFLLSGGMAKVVGSKATITPLSTFQQ